MNKEEFEKAKRFLDSKRLPTSEDILKLFFTEEEAVDLMNSAQVRSVNFEDLGEADDVETVRGTEWVATKFIWDTPEGPVSMVNLVKIGKPLFGDFGLASGLYDKRPIFPFSEEIVDINYEDVIEDAIPLSYREQLNIAIENEDFEEAARLRDWDTGLKELMLKLKPKIMKALKDENPDVLENCLFEIRKYRNTL